MRMIEIFVTDVARDFLAQHPRFEESFERLVALINRTFGRTYQPADRRQELLFNLGESCRTDFLDILFLAVNGRVHGAEALLRPFYERAVALAYMNKHSEKAERFIRFAAIQEFKVMEAALKLVTEQQFNAAIGTNAAAAIRAARESEKEEFTVVACKQCQRKGIAMSWDKDNIEAQARELGSSYTDLYLNAYVAPNLHVHATLASAMKESKKEPSDRADLPQRESASILLIAGAVILLVVETQNDIFSLGLAEDLESAWRKWLQVWEPPDTVTSLS